MVFAIWVFDKSLTPLLHSPEFKTTSIGKFFGSQSLDKIQTQINIWRCESVISVPLLIPIYSSSNRTTFDLVSGTSDPNRQGRSGVIIAGWLEILKGIRLGHFLQWARFRNDFWSQLRPLGQSATASWAPTDTLGTPNACVLQ